MPSDRTNVEDFPDSEEGLDDPYIRIVSTEEFVETVERAGQKETDNVSAPI